MRPPEPVELHVFVPGPLRNPMRGSHGHWRKHARWAKSWRERTAERLRIERLLHPRMWQELGDAAVPKHVAFLARTARAWDDDNLRPGLKPVRDGLQDAGLIQSDASEAGHLFLYEQRVDVANRGVDIRIRRR